MSEVLDGLYQILEPIGRGGGGTVYKGYHLRLKKDIVLKKIHREVRDKHRETDILKSLHHSGLPQIYDFIDSGNDTFVVMEFIEGKNFKELLAEKGFFSEREAAEYCIQILEILAYLHSQDPPVIHGDIKPGNLMLRPDGRVCLIDFNISGYFTDSLSSAVGYSVGYAPPEQVKAAHRSSKGIQKQNGKKRQGVSPLATTVFGIGPEDNNEDYEENDVGPNSRRNEVREDETGETVGVESDLYSLGVCLHHFVTGKRPNSINGYDTPLSEEEGIDAGFAEIVDRAESFDKRDRFRSARQIQEALQEWLRGGTENKGKPRRGKAVAAAAILMLLIIGLSVFFFVERGVQQRKRQSEYAEMTGRLSELRAQGDREQFETLYEECVAIDPESSAAYIEKARFLYETREYEAAVSFSEEQADKALRRGDREGAADLYFVAGNASFDQGDTQRAVQDLESAVALGGDNPAYFRDYAIALADIGKISEAQKILDLAEQKGLLNDQAALVRGEIGIMSGDYETGLRDLSSCIDVTENDYVRMRAYVLSARAIGRKEPTEENLLQKSALLEKAAAELPPTYQPPILEDLAGAYSSLLELTGDTDYAGEAIRVLDKVTANGWANLTTYNNLVILYQKKGDITSALECALRMEELYPERYETYKRLAFVDIALEEQKPNDERSYDTFREHYLKADELAKEELTGNRTDMEMEILRDAYEQMINEGWIG